MTTDKLHQAGFDHPCKQTCSGWQQGYERGKLACDKCLEKDADIAERVQREKNLRDDWLEARAEIVRLHEKYDHQRLVQENERLTEALSYLLKVPTEPYEKEMAKEILFLRDSCERLREALEFYASMKFNREKMEWMPGNPDKATNTIKAFDEAKEKRK